MYASGHVKMRIDRSCLGQRAHFPRLAVSTISVSLSSRHFCAMFGIALGVVMLQLLCLYGSRNRRQPCQNELFVMG